MDEEKYLKGKEKIKRYRMLALSSIIAGCVLLTIGFVYLYLWFPFLPESFWSFVLYFIPMIAVFAVFIILGLWARSEAEDLVIELEADKEQERRKAQQPIQAATAEPIARIQYCPSCGKKLQPDWKVCGYCGKKLKKSD